MSIAERLLHEEHAQGGRIPGCRPRHRPHGGHRRAHHAGTDGRPGPRPSARRRAASGPIRPHGRPRRCKTRSRSRRNGTVDCGVARGRTGRQVHRPANPRTRAAGATAVGEGGLSLALSGSTLGRADNRRSARGDDGFAAASVSDLRAPASAGRSPEAHLREDRRRRSRLRDERARRSSHTAPGPRGRFAGYRQC